MAKNKVKVEYDVDMEKERRKKQQKNGKTGFAIRRSNILLYVLLLVVEILFYYFLTPAINVHTSEFWTWVIITLAAIGFCSFDFKGTRITRKGNIKETVGSTKVVMVSFTAILVLIIGLIIGWHLPNCSAHRNMLESSRLRMVILQRMYRKVRISITLR